MRQYILLTLAVLAVLAGVSTYFIARGTVVKRYQAANRMAEKVRVVAPNRDLAIGEKIDPHDLVLIERYKKDVSADEIRLDDVALTIRQTLVCTVQKGTPLRWQDFQTNAPPGQSNPRLNATVRE